MRRPSPWQAAWILIAFLGMAALQAWPLPLHLHDRTTGSPGGDAGVYLWNPWVFRHELVERGANPFTTDLILAAGGPIDLSLHNYTVANNVLALPLLPLAGVVTTFNLIYLLNVALCGLGVFLLARRVHRAVDLGTAEAWLAGMLFACSPFLVARSTAHFSLVAAAALPFFVLAFDRAWRQTRARDAAAAGACLAWAAYSDPYYAVYCVLLGACVAASDLTVRFATTRATTRALSIIIDSLLVAAAVIIMGVAVFGLNALEIGPLRISMRSLYTPVLVLTVLVGARMLMVWRPRFQWQPSIAPGLMLRQIALTLLVGALLLAPLLYAMALRAVDGRMVTAPVMWRSSAPGLDVLAFLAPNPNHPLAPQALVDWLTAEPGRYEENVAAIPWIVLLVVLAGWRSSASSSQRVWLATAVGFAVLALGPFVRIGGILTYIPTPWTLLRYLPVLGEARMPARFGVVVIMAMAIVFAGALAALARRAPHRRRLVLGAVGTALAIELLPVPRTLYPATIPGIYRTIAGDPDRVAVLELPFGVRDGLSSLGDYTARSQFHQTTHGKPLVGGYLSRVSDRRKASYMSTRVLESLMALSAGDAIAPDTHAAAAAAAAELVEQVRLRYVVMHTERTPPALRALALEIFALEPVDACDGYELFRVGTSGSAAGPQFVGSARRTMPLTTRKVSKIDAPVFAPVLTMELPAFLKAPVSRPSPSSVRLGDAPAGARWASDGGIGGSRFATATRFGSGIGRDVTTVSAASATTESAEMSGWRSRSVDPRCRAADARGNAAVATGSDGTQTIAATSWAIGARETRPGIRAVSAASGGAGYTPTSREANGPSSGA